MLSSLPLLSVAPLGMQQSRYPQTRRPLGSSQSHSISCPRFGSAQTLYIASTGGTIDMVLNESGTRTPDKQTPPLATQVLKQAPPNASPNQSLKIRHLNLLDQPTDSSSIDRHLQARIVKQVVNAIKADPKAAMVITHGSDTLMETAALLSYQRLPATIVITGAWAEASHPKSDAALNSLRAAKVATELKLPGVFVVIGDDIHLGSRVNKVRTSPFEKVADSTESRTAPYFISMDDRPIGTFNADNSIKLNEDVVTIWQGTLASQSQSKARAHELSQAHAPWKPIQPAYVEHLIVGKKTPWVVFEQLASRLKQKAPPCGAVLDGELAGHPDLAKIQGLLHSLAANKCFVVTTDTHANTAKHFPLNVTTIPTIHLRAKLAAILKPGMETRDVNTLLKSNLTGEVLGRTAMAETRLKVGGTHLAKDSLVVATPSLSSQEIDHATSRIVNSRNKTLSSHTPDQRLIFLGYGDGHIPIGIHSMKERLLNASPATQSPLEWEKVTSAIEKPVTAQASPSTHAATQSTSYSVSSVLGHIKSVVGVSASEAQQHLSTRLAASHGNLGAVKRAVDKAFDVRMAIKPTFSKANLQSYEIGTILNVLGVKHL